MEIPLNHQVFGDQVQLLLIQDHYWSRNVYVLLVRPCTVRSFSVTKNDFPAETTPFWCRGRKTSEIARCSKRLTTADFQHYFQSWQGSWDRCINVDNDNKSLNRVCIINRVRVARCTYFVQIKLLWVTFAAMAMPWRWTLDTGIPNTSRIGGRIKRQ